MITYIIIAFCALIFAACAGIVFFGKNEERSIGLGVIAVSGALF